MIYLYIITYGILLIYGRFSGICGASYRPLFTLLENPAFYPKDMYVHSSIVATTTYLYSFLGLFGKLFSNAYGVFVLHALIGLAHIYFIFKIAELLFGDLKKYNVGLIVLLLFLYDYPIFFAFSQLVSQHSFSQGTAVMPILAAGLYYYLKDKKMLALFLISIVAIPLSLKNSWIILLIILVYLSATFKKLSLKQIVLACFFLAVSGLIVLSYRAGTIGSPLTFSRRLEFCKFIIVRGGAEDIILLNSIAYFLKFFLIFFTGMYCVRFIKNPEHRHKLYILYKVAVGVFIFGILYHSFLYKWFPITELFTLGFPRSMAYPIIMSIILIGGFLVYQIIKKETSPFKRAMGVAALFILAYFPNFKLKSIFIYIACIALAHFFIYRIERIPKKMKLWPPAAWLFTAVILFTLVRDSQMVFKSYKTESPFFPFVIFGFNKEDYDCQLWAKENTPVDSVFVSFRLCNNKLSWDTKFRGYSARAGLYGAAVMELNSELSREHARRGEFVDSLIELIEKGGDSEIKRLIKKAPWKIDYIVVPSKFSLDFKKVYSGSSYSCYSVNAKEAK